MLRGGYENFPGSVDGTDENVMFGCCHVNLGGTLVSRFIHESRRWLHSYANFVHFKFTNVTQPCGHEIFAISR